MFLLILFSFINPVPLEGESETACELKQLRMSFHKSVVDEDKVQSFYQLTSMVESCDVVVQSYKAAGHVMKAKTTWNPVEKLRLVLKYQGVINSLIEENPHNVEVRFLRFSIAYYLPDMFGFKKSMQLDKKALMANLNQFEVEDLDPVFNQFILWFINECGFYTTNEIAKIEAHLS